jgi:beta-aspartyl-peptidase (threonine type)
MIRANPLDPLSSAFCQEVNVQRIIAAVVFTAMCAPARADDDLRDVVLAVHGGAGVLDRAEMTPEKDKAYRAKLREALDAGRTELQRAGGTSLDAVVAAIRVLEDSPLFNAGKGGAFTRDETVELDASLMDGRTRRAGAVTGARTIKNPIVGARRVMEKTRHVMLAGRGADELAKANGAEIVEPSYFETEHRRQLLRDARQREAGKTREPQAGASREVDPRGDTRGSPSSWLALRADAEPRFGTVGCVALDRDGNLAAGTSTGGLTMKLSGRVGDSPIIGAGTFADNRSCAVSCTGDGEYFIRAVAAHDIAALVEYRGLSLRDASRTVIHEKIKSAGGEGGAIVLDVRGDLAFTYSSEGMYRGYVTRGGEARVLIYAD